MHARRAWTDENPRRRGGPRRRRGPARRLVRPSLGSCRWRSAQGSFAGGYLHQGFGCTAFWARGLERPPGSALDQAGMLAMVPGLPPGRPLRRPPRAGTTAAGLGSRRPRPLAVSPRVALHALVGGHRPRRATSSPPRRPRRRALLRPLPFAGAFVHDPARIPSLRRHPRRAGLRVPPTLYRHVHLLACFGVEIRAGRPVVPPPGALHLAARVRVALLIAALTAYSSVGVGRRREPEGARRGDGGR